MASPPRCCRASTTPTATSSPSRAPPPDPRWSSRPRTTRSRPSAPACTPRWTPSKAAADLRYRAQSALDVPARRGDALAGDPVGLVRGEEDRDLADIVGLTDPPQRRLRSGLLLEIAADDAERRGARSIDHAGRDGVDADLARPELGCQCPGDRIERALGAGIDRQGRDRLGAGDRAHVDDAAAIAVEMRDRLAGREQGPEHVDVELTAIFRLGDFLDRLEAVDAGIVDQHIDRAEGLLRLGKEPLHIRFLGNIGLDGDRLAALLPDRGDDALGVVLGRGVIHYDG